MVKKATFNKSGYDNNSTYFECNFNSNYIPCIFIHGVGLNISMWSKQKKFFKKNIIFYDLLNHGKTKNNLNPVKYSDFNNQLKKLIDFLDLKKINLVGFSMGSTIAINFAIKFKENINKLVLISTAYKRSNEEIKHVISRYNQAKKGLNIQNSAVNRWFTNKYLKQNPKVNKFFLNLLKSNKSKNFLPVYKLFASSNNINNNFKNFNIPTLIITGDSDINSTPNMSLKLSKEIKNSKILIVSNAKHMAIYEKEKIINLQIKKFLK
tara:strand:+ start:4594 stop:5388 length:795 start_codon:yes stop_codon:yes gene_type:complete